MLKVSYIFLCKNKPKNVSYMIWNILVEQTLPNNTLIITISSTIISVENLHIYLSLCWLFTLEPLFLYFLLYQCIIDLNKFLDTDVTWKTSRIIMILFGANTVSQGGNIISTGLICFQLFHSRNLVTIQQFQN